MIRVAVMIVFCPGTKALDCPEPRLGTNVISHVAKIAFRSCQSLASLLAYLPIYLDKAVRSRCGHRSSRQRWDPCYKFSFSEKKEGWPSRTRYKDRQ
jgi:hypothetical protein